MCRVVFPPFSRCLSSLWRALLIYSGEIFKFDFPRTLDEPNCIPTADGMHWTLPIGDGAAIPPDNTEDGTLASAEPLSPQDPYIAALGRDIPRAKSVVQYIHVSARLGIPSRRLETKAQNMFQMFSRLSSGSCPGIALDKEIVSLMVVAHSGEK